MAYYDLNPSSSDLIQANGTSITQQSTRYDSGTLRRVGTIQQLSNRFRSRTIDDSNKHRMIPPVMTQRRIGIDIQQANQINSGVQTNSIACTINELDGRIRVNLAFPNVSIELGDCVALSSVPNGFLDSSYKVISSVISGVTQTLILSGEWPRVTLATYPAVIGKTGMSDVIIDGGLDFRPPEVRAYNNVTPGQYAMKMTTPHLHSANRPGITLATWLNSGGADFQQRNKVHARQPQFEDNVIYNLIRLGYWDPYIGNWDLNRMPKRFPVFTENFGQDDETVEQTTSNQSVGGEFAYRYGITKQESYDN